MKSVSSARMLVVPLFSVLLLSLSAVVATFSPASAQSNGWTLTNLHSFGGYNANMDGMVPYGALAAGSDGNFYGTTSGGGLYNCGTVYSITPQGAFDLLYTFTDDLDGAAPEAGLVLGRDGNFYGTTSRGWPTGTGTVFKITPAGEMTTLYQFGALDANGLNSDGSMPVAALAVGNDDAFYGTTEYGGAYGNGTVFKITAAGAMTTLHSFSALDSDGFNTDGANSTANLVLGNDGNFYGTAQYGGVNGNGTIFRITPDGSLTTLYSFTNAPDGANPMAGLALGSDSNFYGSTWYGGANGNGTIFMITSVGAYTTLTSFAWSTISYRGYYINTDGFRSNGLLLGSDGNFYGSALVGGANGSGTVIEITPAGAGATLYSFSALSEYSNFNSDGAEPYGALVAGSDGSLYGTASAGGENSSGAIFKLTPPAIALTTTGLDSSPNPSMSGAPVTFVASISPSVPDGETVTFYNGTTIIGIGQTSASVAECTTTQLAVGADTITASYPGDARHQPSTSWPCTQTVNSVSISTSTSLASSLNPSVYGAAVTFTATVSPSVPDGGTVTFHDGAATIGTGQTIGSMATLTTASLIGGSHSITATYARNGIYQASTSSALTQIVTTGAQATTTTLTSSANPVALSPYSSGGGAAVTLSATISPSVPDGETVTFYNGSSSLGTAMTTGSVAAFNATIQPIGSYNLTATYTGDAGNASSTSSPLTETVTGYATATTLASSPNPTAIGVPVTFSMNIIPTGSLAIVELGGGWYDILDVPYGDPVTIYDNGTPIGTTPLVGVTLYNWIASYTTSSLSAGSHTITAGYSGDSYYEPSTSNAVTQTIISPGPQATATSLTSSLNPATYGASVTLTATVSPSVADGETVLFSDGASLIGTGTTTSSVASFTTTSLAIGSHTIAATYPGDTNNAPSTSTALTETINVASTTTTLTSSLNPAGPFDNPAYTATISPSVPDGEIVTFYSGSVSIGTAQTYSGTASYTPASLGVGVYSITADYSGDANYAASTSGVLTQTVSQDTTTTTITLSPNPSALGGAVEITASIGTNVAYGVPNGETVTFYDGASTLGTASTNGGVATLTTTSLGAGSHSITASYPGDASFSGSMSSAVTQTVNTIRQTSTAISSSLNPSAFGQSVNFTANVSPSVPDGETVTFYDGASALGTGATSGSVAQFSASSLAAGSHRITASYAGDANFTQSTSSALTQTMNKAATSTSLASSLNPSAPQAAVTFTATLSPAVPNGETITFYDGATPIGAGTTTGSVATLTTSALVGGSHNITAGYPGDANYGASTSSALSQSVVAGSTTTSIGLSSSLNPSTYGQSVTFTATISPAVPDGETVTFASGAASIGTATTSGGTATLATSALAAGSDSITANYAGDANFAACTSSVLTQTVNQAATSTSVASSLNPSALGVPVTFTATISPAVPNGELVTFSEGGNTLAIVSTFDGVATMTSSTLSVGSNSITAAYAGDANNLPSTSTAFTQTVVAGTSTTTAVTSSKKPSNYGDAVTFTATITPAVPDGEVVTFYDGVLKVFIGTGVTAGGVASLTISTLATGTHSIRAQYAGDGNNRPSLSAALSQTVNQVRPAITLTSSANPSIYGQSVTFNVTLNPAVPDGEVVQFNNYSSYTVLGIAVTSSGTATFSTLSLPAGSIGIEALYGGESNYEPAVAYLTQAVQAPTTTTLVSSLNPAPFGSSVTFTATISPAVPDGETITFLDGATSLGTGATTGSVATLATSTLSAGSHSITSSYPGDANFVASTSSAVSQSIVTGSTRTTTGIKSSPSPSCYGTPVMFTAWIRPIPANGETVTFYDAGSQIGTGTTATGGLATLTIPKLALGSHSITAAYMGDATYAPSTSAVLIQTVHVCHLTTSLATSLNPALPGTAVTFTATLSTCVPDGETVTFYDGPVSKGVIGTGTTVGGVATFTTSALVWGSHTIWADYVGDGNYAYSWSNSVSQTIVPTTTTTGIKSSPNPSNYGAPVLLTAWVRPIPPDGETVIFCDGGNQIGTGTLSGGVATFLATGLTVGSHSITASYSDDAVYTGSTSAALTQTVHVCHPTTALASSLNPSTHGSSVTFTATVSPCVPDGETVTFYDGATSKKCIGTGTTAGGVATLTTSTLCAGSHTIWAEYVGDAGYAYSWSCCVEQTLN